MTLFPAVFSPRRTGSPRIFSLADNSYYVNRDLNHWKICGPLKTIHTVFRRTSTPF